MLKLGGPPRIKHPTEGKEEREPYALGTEQPREQPYFVLRDPLRNGLNMYMIKFIIIEREFGRQARQKA